MANKPSILLIASFLCFLLVASYAVANSSENSKEVAPNNDEASKEVVPDKADPVIELVTNNPEVINQRGREEARQCRLNRISPSRPRRHIQSEGGLTELWNEFEDQFQCTGVAPMRNIIRPNSLSLLNYSPAPRLVYIEQGRALLGFAIPGCPATYHSSRSGGEQSRRHDDHQQVHRVQRGDIVVLPPGIPHWCFNDGNEDVIAVSITHLNNEHNQLDQKLRSFYLAGGQDRESQSGGSQSARDTFQNILRAFDANLLAEALNVPVRITRNMQRERGEGFIVTAREDMRIIHADEYQDEESEEEREGSSRYREEEEREGGRSSRYRQGEEAGMRENGIEEIACNMRFHYHMDDRREADLYSRHAGRLNIVNRFKLPILSYVDLSAERGELYPDAMHAPHWTNNAHTIVYIIRGEAHAQVVGSNGERIMDDRVRQGDMFSVPQYFASTLRAGRNGVEWVAFKTSAAPVKTTLAGANSAFRALPAQVIAVSYGISIDEALELKFGREKHIMLLPPVRSRGRGDMSN